MNRSNALKWRYCIKFPDVKPALSFLTFLALPILFLSGTGLTADKKFINGEENGLIHWYTFPEAVALSQKNPRKIFVDIYTDWCGWCKVLNRETFSHPVIAAYLSSKFYPVKFNAESADTIRFLNAVFANPNAGQRGATHQFAVSILDGKLSYPSLVFLDENIKRINIMQGFMKPDKFEPYLKYYGEGKYVNSSFEEFQKTFTGNVKSN